MFKGNKAHDLNGFLPEIGVNARVITCAEDNAPVGGDSVPQGTLNESGTAPRDTLWGLRSKEECVVPRLTSFVMYVTSAAKNASWIREFHLSNSFFLLCEKRNAEDITVFHLGKKTHIFDCHIPANLWRQIWTYECESRDKYQYALSLHPYIVNIIRMFSTESAQIRLLEKLICFLWVRYRNREMRLRLETFNSCFLSAIAHLASLARTKKR